MRLTTLSGRLAGENLEAADAAASAAVSEAYRADAEALAAQRDRLLAHLVDCLAVSSGRGGEGSQRAEAY